MNSLHTKNASETLVLLDDIFDKFLRGFIPLIYFASSILVNIGNRPKFWHSLNNSINNFQQVSGGGTIGLGWAGSTPITSTPSTLRLLLPNPPIQIFTLYLGSTLINDYLLDWV